MNYLSMRKTPVPSFFDGPIFFRYGHVPGRRSYNTSLAMSPSFREKRTNLRSKTLRHSNGSRS